MRLGLALGGGAARGLAHIPVLEAVEELGLRPVGIAGTSIGAMIGAAYAAEGDAEALRAHTLDFFANRARAVMRLAGTRQGGVFRHGLIGGATFDAEKLMRAAMPVLPENFERLALPFAAIAADYYTREAVVLREGPLLSAVAASAAVPGLVRPVLREGRVLVDGCLIDPLPFTSVPGAPDLVLACDVTGAPAGAAPTIPQTLPTLFAAGQIMMGTLIRMRLERERPDILVSPDLTGFRAMDFLKARQILDAAAPIKETVKHALHAALERA